MINPSRYRIIAVGRIRKDWIRDGISTYLKRLPGLTITEIRNSNPTKEAEAIYATLRNSEKLILLSEKGELLTSVKFARRLDELNAHRLAFVIGGVDGLTAQLKRSAQWDFSLSPLTFPHEVARLLLAEQLYRAYSILQKSPYHRH